MARPGIVSLSGGGLLSGIALAVKSRRPEARVLGVPMAWAFFEHHLLVEGGAAVGLAALRAGKLDLPAGPVVVVISGRNVDLSTLLERVRRVARGRR